MNAITTASSQLFTRSDDEVFSGWGDLITHLRNEKARTVEIPLNRLSAVAHRDGLHAEFVGTSPGADQSSEGYQTEMSDWSFATMTKFTGVRGAYGTLNSLSPQTSADALNELLEKNSSRYRERVALVHLPPDGNPVTRAFYSPIYQRVSDLEVFTHFHSLSEQFGYEPAGEFAGKRGGLSPVRPEASGLYRGDRSSFGFIANERGKIDIDNSSLYHAVMWGNSEVGSQTLWFLDVLYNFICGNHMVWNPMRLRTVKHKHTEGVRTVLQQATRMFEDVDRERGERKIKTEEMFSKASTTQFADTRELIEKKLQTHKLKKKDAILAGSYLEHPSAYPKNPTSVWGVAQAITLASQEKGLMDEKRAMDRVAGNLLSQLA
tara:strand:+ start:799 stop:1929 length:1131 start_codon:yes stop_codon:yes gene_type:complete